MFISLCTLICFFIFSCTSMKQVEKEEGEKKGVTAPAGVAPVITDVRVNVDAFKEISVFKPELLGQNMAIWEKTEDGRDTEFNELMKAMEGLLVRYPGGGYADWYVWDTMGMKGSAAWTVNNDECIAFVTSFSGELQPCVNFSGYWNDTRHNFEETLQKAEEWVRYMNIEKKLGLRYWEIGNETNLPQQKGHTSGDDYGMRFARFYKRMKTVDPSIKIGCQVSPCDEYSGDTETTWSAQALINAKKEGVIPDFLIVHEYPSRTGRMSASTDKEILSRALFDIKLYTDCLDSMITKYLGKEYLKNIEYFMTEYRSGLGNDVQNFTMLDAMFTVEYIMEMAKYGWDGANIWDIKNGIDEATGGDYGIVAKPWQYQAENLEKLCGAVTGNKHSGFDAGGYVEGFAENNGAGNLP
jgi:alpha-L-arabinofuranosidase